MKMKVPTCDHCGAIGGIVKMYMSSFNLLKIPMKTYYCKRCAPRVVPGQQPISDFTGKTK